MNRLASFLQHIQDCDHNVDYYFVYFGMAVMSIVAAIFGYGFWGMNCMICNAAMLLLLIAIWKLLSMVNWHGVRVSIDRLVFGKDTIVV